MRGITSKPSHTMKYPDPPSAI